MLSTDEVKSSDDLKRERELLSELLELVQKRSFIVDSLEEERVRYLFFCPHFISVRKQSEYQNIFQSLYAG